MYRSLTITTLDLYLDILKFPIRKVVVKTQYVPLSRKRGWVVRGVLLRGFPAPNMKQHHQCPEDERNTHRGKMSGVRSEKTCVDTSEVLGVTGGHRWYK